MSNSIQRDQQRRSLFAKLEKTRRQLQCITRNLSMPVSIRSLCARRLNSLNRNSSLMRVRNRCVLSGRGRSVYGFSKLSRIKLRELVCQGHVLGVYKSSW